MGQGPQKGRLLPLKPMGKVVLKKTSMSSVSHIPVEKAHIVSDLKKSGVTPSLFSDEPPPLSGGYKRRSIAAIIHSVISEKWSQHLFIGIAGGWFSIVKCVKMSRRPFIFWLYSCKIWLLTLIDSPICTWWLVELFITKTGNQPITKGSFF